MNLVRLDAGLFSFLCAQEQLAALVGTRVFPDFAGQGEPSPLIVYQLEDYRPELAQAGPTGGGSAVYLLTIWAKTRAEAMELAGLLEACLHGYRGDWNGIRITGVTFDGGSRGYNPDTLTFSFQIRITVTFRNR